MVHNGLDKLVDPEGFAKFVVEPYLGFLPHDEPLSFVTWTYLAAGAELVGAAGLTLGFLTRLSAASLFSTMGLAVYFHIAQSGLEGFPLGVVQLRRWRPGSRRHRPGARHKVRPSRSRHSGGR